jgi:hypothetical protein
MLQSEDDFQVFAPNTVTNLYAHNFYNIDENEESKEIIEYRHKSSKPLTAVASIDNINAFKSKGLKMTVNDSLKHISKRPNLILREPSASIHGQNDSFVQSVIITTKSNDLNTSLRKVPGSP